MAVTRATQYALCPLLLMVTAFGLQLHKDTPISDDNATEDAPGNATTALASAVPVRRADRTKPRMLVSQGCDASAAIIRHAHFILRLHNVSTPWRKIHTLHDTDFAQLAPEEDGSDDDDNSNFKEAVSLGQFWPFDDLASLRVSVGASHLAETAPGANDSSSEGQHMSETARVLAQEGEAASEVSSAASSAVLRFHEYYKRMNKSFIFKGTIGKDLNVILSKGLLDLGTQTAEISRKNRIDQVVCMVKDCFDNGNLGHPVLNGKVSDICWKRRSMNVTDLAGYKAFIKPGALIDAMTTLNGKAFQTAAALQDLGYPMEGVLYTEDLLDFEWNKEAVGTAVRSWISLLKDWGIGPYKGRITAYLTNNAGTIEPPALHTSSIANFEQIKSALSDHKRFSWMLRE